MHQIESTSVALPGTMHVSPLCSQRGRHEPDFAIDTGEFCPFPGSHTEVDFTPHAWRNCLQQRALCSQFVPTSHTDLPHFGVEYARSRMRGIALATQRLSSGLDVVNFAFGPIIFASFRAQAKQT